MYEMRRRLVVEGQQFLALWIVCDGCDFAREGIAAGPSIALCIPDLFRVEGIGVGMRIPEQVQVSGGIGELEIEGSRACRYMTDIVMSGGTAQFPDGDDGVGADGKIAVVETWGDLPQFSVLGNTIGWLEIIGIEGLGGIEGEVPEKGLSGCATTLIEGHACGSEYKSIDRKNEGVDIDALLGKVDRSVCFAVPELDPVEIAVVAAYHDGQPSAIRAECHGFYALVLAFYCVGFAGALPGACVDDRYILVHGPGYDIAVFTECKRGAGIGCDLEERVMGARSGKPGYPHGCGGIADGIFCCDLHETAAGGEEDLFSCMGNGLATFGQEGEGLAKSVVADGGLEILLLHDPGRLYGSVDAGEDLFGLAEKGLGLGGEVEGVRDQLLPVGFVELAVGDDGGYDTCDDEYGKRDDGIFCVALKSVFEFAIGECFFYSVEDMCGGVAFGEFFDGFYFASESDDERLPDGSGDGVGKVDDDDIR